MKERLGILGIALGAIFIYLPLKFVLHSLAFITLFLQVLDLPIWLLSGKTPFSCIHEKVQTAGYDF